MKQEITDKSEIKLIGLTVRTNNNDEMDWKKAKIGSLVAQFFSQNVAAEIPERVSPGSTLCVYTDYDSNEHGEYTYFIGEEVSSHDNIPSSMKGHTIPASQYVKFTTSNGPMPEVVLNAWQQIWKMTSNDFGGNRTYKADFEYYDQRAMDPANTCLDIYVGIEKA